MARDEDFRLNKVQWRIARFLVLLDEQKLLENFSKELPFRWVSESGPKGKNHRIHIVMDQPLTFASITLNKMIVVPDLSLRCTRTGRDGQELVSHNLLIRLWERPKTGDAQVIFRAHVDLASEKQQGPWSHLQIGGRAGIESTWHLPEQIGEIRWPMQLFDIVLGCELIVYSLWPEKWFQLCQKPEFLLRVQESEDFFIKHYIQRYADYFNVNGKDRKTLVSMLCNKRNEHPWQ